MNIELLSINKYQLTNTKPVKKVSFGESEDYNDSYSAPRITKSQYEARKSIINEKYNNMRSSYLNDADDLEFDNSVVWQQLKRIEEMRDSELSSLESEW
ncbi:hypothetical protein J6O48_08735 [bacterium]|nr:hypothetical protein [bacterium]